MKIYELLSVKSVLESIIHQHANGGWQVLAEGKPKPTKLRRDKSYLEQVVISETHIVKFLRFLVQ